MANPLTDSPAYEKYAQQIFVGMLVLFFVAATHYLQLNRSGVGLELPFNTMGWIPIAVAMGASFFIIARRERVHYTALSGKLLVLVCLLIMPFFLPSANQDAVFDRMLGLMAGMLLLLGMQQFAFSREQKLLLLLLIIAAVWVELIIGWDRFLRSLGIGVSGSRGVWQGLPTGIFQQRNLYASIIAVGIVLSGYVLAYACTLHDRKIQSYTPLLLLLPLAGIHMLNAQYSRTGWFGFYIGTVLVLPYLWRHAGKVLCILWLASIAGGYLLSWSFEESGSIDIPEKDMVTLQGLRQIHYPQTVDMVLEKPLLGYGYGRFEKAYLEYTAEQYAEGRNEEPGISRLDHPHNELLLWAAEGGIYALVIVLLAAWFVGQRVMRLQWLHGLAVVGIFFPIVLHTQVEYPFYQSVLHWVVFIILIYWVDQLTAEEKSVPLKSTLLVSLCAFLVPMITAAFMITTLYTGYLIARFESGIDPNVESLQKMVNPVVFSDKINWAIMSRLVMLGAINNDPVQVQPYIEWAPQLLEDKPRPNFYRFLVLAYRVAGDEANRRRVQQEAEYLFPGERFDAPDLEPGQLSPVPFDAVSR